MRRAQHRCPGAVGEVELVGRLLDEDGARTLLRPQAGRHATPTSCKRKVSIRQEKHRHERKSNEFVFLSVPTGKPRKGHGTGLPSARSKFNIFGDRSAGSGHHGGPALRPIEDAVWTILHAAGIVLATSGTPSQEVATATRSRGARTWDLQCVSK